MKKFMMIAVAVCLAFMLAAPASASEISFSGYYKLRGLYNSNNNLLESDASNAYYKNYLRIAPTLKISDDLDVKVRIDQLNGDRSGNATAGIPAVERFYATYKTDLGIFQWGRMAGGNWGMGWADYDSDSDRIRWTGKGGSWLYGVILEKVTEGDEGTTKADGDKEVYWAFAYSKTESLSYGLLGGYVNDMTTSTYSAKYTAWLPYFKGQFGAFGIAAEAVVLRGDSKDYDPGLGTDVDRESEGFAVEGTLGMDKFSFLAGFAYGSGDDGAAANAKEDTAFPYGVGTEHDQLWILGNDSFGYYTGSSGFGNGMGNLAYGAGTAISYGYQMWYASGAFQATDAMKVKLLVGGSKADAVPTGWDDDHGIEVDFTLSYKITDALVYTFIAAYLDAGDFWKAGVAGTKIDGNTSIWHNIQVNF